MRAQGKVHQEHPASQTPPKSWVLGSVAGGGGALNTPGLSPAVPSSPTWAKLRHCRSSSCHAMVGTRVRTPTHTRAEVAHVVRRHRSCALDVPRSPARSGPACVPRSLGIPKAAAQPPRGCHELSRPGNHTATGRARSQLPLVPNPTFGAPSCRRARGHPSAPPQRPGLAGELGCGRIRPPCPTPALRGALVPGSSPDLGQEHRGESCLCQPALLKVKEED